MQTVSATYERLANSSNKYYQAKLVIDDVGEFAESEMYSIRTHTAMFSGTPEVGKAVAGEITIVMDMPSTSIPRMACLRPYIRAKGTAAKSSTVTITDDGKLSSSYASYSNGKVTFSSGANITVSGEKLIAAADTTEEVTSEWIPQGVYYIDTREVTANSSGVKVLTIHGYDAMLLAEQDYSSNDVVSDAPDTAFVQAIADAIGVDVDPRTWEIMQGYTIPFPIGYSMREILGYIASSYVGCFVMTNEGKLRLVSLLGLPAYDETSLLKTNTGYVILFGGDAILV